MIEYQDFITAKIIPNYGISEFILGTDITYFYKFLEEKEIYRIENELTNKSILYNQIKLWNNSVILIFDNNLKLLKNIILTDEVFSFEKYKIGMTLDDAMNIKTSIYNTEYDEDAIYHSLYDGIKFNLSFDIDDKIIISSFEIFDLK